MSTQIKELKEKIQKFESMINKPTTPEQQKKAFTQMKTNAEAKLAELEAKDETEAKTETTEVKTEVKSKKKGKAAKKPAMGKGMKQILKENKQKPTKIIKGAEKEESHKSVDTDKKWKYNSTVKKVSDEHYLIYYKGEHTMDAEIKFNGSEWDLICKEVKDYPKFKKSQVEMAITFVLEVKDCIHSKISNLEQAKERKKLRTKYDKLSESKKAENAVDKAAESVENRVEEAKEQGGGISVATATEVIVDVKKIVASIKSGLKESAERKAFITKLINELKKLL